MKKILLLLSLLLITGCNKNVEPINNEIDKNIKQDTENDVFLSNSFYLDDQVYVFPFTPQSFLDNGWQSEELEDKLNPGDYKELSFFKDGYKELRMIAYNDTDKQQDVINTNIHYIAGSKNSLGDSLFSYYGDVLGKESILFEDKEFDLETPKGKIPEYENVYEDRVMYSLLNYDSEKKFKSFEIMSQEFKNVLVERDLEDLRQQEK